MSRFTTNLQRNPVAIHALASTGYVNQESLTTTKNSAFPFQANRNSMSALVSNGYGSHQTLSGSIRKGVAVKRDPGSIYYDRSLFQSSASHRRSMPSDQFDNFESTGGSLDRPAHKKRRVQPSTRVHGDDDRRLHQWLQQLEVSKQPTLKMPKKDYVSLSPPQKKNNSKPFSEFPDASPSDGCDHPPAACLGCIKMNMRAALKAKSFSDKVATCPECNASLGYDAVKAFEDPETFGVYDNHLMKKAAEKLGGWFSCPGLGRECGSGQIHDGGEAGPIHETMSCDEYDRFQEDPDNFRSTFEVANEAAEAKAPKKTAMKAKVSKRGSKAQVTKPKKGVSSAAAVRAQAVKDTKRKKAEENASKQGSWMCLVDFDDVRKNSNDAHKRSCSSHSDNLPALIRNFGDYA
ncbi:hypothetical protein B0H63DRAFT_449394 [Podospora didyma]|uniref:Uncharacterized protein n=1 Tax=Podospora didyma TaxID=330526 RepID=A0AAE0NPI6_9PEZI|nr:hypothetical protein B0H63DRAFT_449394 [Podospora didyma]